MRIGLDALPLDGLRLGFVFSSVLILSLGHPRGRPPSLDPRLKPSIVALRTRQLRRLGFVIFLLSCIGSQTKPQSFIAIMLVQFIRQTIRFNIIVRNILILIFIFVLDHVATGQIRVLHVLHPLSMLIYSQRAFQLLCFLTLDPV